MNDIAKQPSLKVQAWVKFIIHFLCLGIIFILPEVLMGRSSPSLHIPPPMYVKALMFVGVFYINYYIIIDRYLGKKYWAWKIIGWNLFFALITIIIVNLMHGMLSGPDYAERPHRPHRPSGYTFILAVTLRDIVMIVLTAALSMAMKLSDYWVKLTSQKRELEAAQNVQELQNLKNQLNPHFLFNTLNSIYALIAINPSDAQKSVHDLSQLLRYALYDTLSMVPLKSEMEFIENYIKLMKLRIGNNIPIDINLDYGAMENSAVAPMLFISPVENAFKYGNTGLPDAFISISIVAKDGVIVCEITNTFVPDSSQPAEHQHSSGIGSSNLKRRLDIIYGKKACLDTAVSGNKYTFKLVMDINS